MLHRLILSSFLVLALIEAVLATAGLSSVDHWQRVDLRSTAPLRNVSEIKIAIRTRGPSIQGLIRIPGGIASNFDTSSGTTFVDLINIDSEIEGYAAELFAVEVLLPQSIPDQFFEIWVVDYSK